MSYSIIEADLDKNRGDILELWKRNFPDVPKGRYQWAYLNNPHGKAKCWLLREEKSERFVGSAALFPRRVWVDGECRLAGIAADFCVDKEHRGFNAALLLQRAVVSSYESGDFDFLYGFPNKKSELMQKRVGFIQLGKIKRLAKPLKTEKKIAEHSTQSLAKITSSPVDFALKKLSKESRYKRPPGISVKILKDFDQRFDPLWKKANPQFRIIGQRNSQFMNWRYTANPHKNYQTFSVVRDDQKSLLGYVVYYLENDICGISDILCSDQESVLDLLLSEFLIFQRKEEIDTISVILLGFPFLFDKLKSFGFHPREEDSVVLIYANESQEHLPLLLGQDNWLMLEGDRDI